MKNIMSWIGLLVIALTLVGCGETKDTMQTITFNHDDIESVEAQRDSEIDLPFVESDTGFFLGWEDELGVVHNQTYIVDEDITLTPVFELFKDVLELVFDDEDNTVRIAEYNGSARRVKIPHTFDGYHVHSIGSEAFMEKETLRVDIPMTVHYLGIQAFANMPNLKEVHYYGDYLGTIERTMNPDQFNDMIDANDVCQSTSLDEDPTEENPWLFDEGCPVSKITGKTEAVTMPDGSTYFAYYVEMSIKYMSGNLYNQHFSTSPFIGSDALTTVTLPDKLGFFDSEIFLGAENIEAVYIENNTKIYSDNGVIFETDTDNLLYYPSGQLTKDFVIPNRIEHIKSTALIGSQVETITLHENLTFEPGAFVHLTGLKTFVIVGDLPSITVDDGIMYNSDQTELLVYPAGKEDAMYTVNSGVISIEEYAFMNQQHLEHLVISEGVEVIMPNAFYINPSLTTVDIASTVEYIGFNNFWNGQNEETLETMIIRNENTVIHAPGLNLNNSEDLVIYIPDSLIQAYTDDDYWQHYADQFVPLSELAE